MKIIILNGNSNPENAAFDNYLRELSHLMESRNHEISVFNLREMDIRYCTGCFACWVKTPGECITQDDSHNICRAYIRSDLVLFASPVIMGFTSALLKRAHDKLIPLIHPYFEFVQNEVYHLSRYEYYPLIALLLERGRDTDEEDIEIISDIYRQTAINLKTSLPFTRLTSDSTEEVADEIDSI